LPGPGAAHRGPVRVRRLPHDAQAAARDPATGRAADHRNRGGDVAVSNPDQARVERRHRGLRRRRRRRIAIIAGAIGTNAAGQWLGRTAGSTPAERRQPLPGDELVDYPSVVTNHATTIQASPEKVWPWLVQMG